MPKYLALHASSRMVLWISYTDDNISSLFDSLKTSYIFVQVLTWWNLPQGYTLRHLSVISIVTEP